MFARQRLFFGTFKLADACLARTGRSTNSHLHHHPFGRLKEKLQWDQIIGSHRNAKLLWALISNKNMFLRLDLKKQMTLEVILTVSGRIKKNSPGQRPGSVREKNTGFQDLVLFRSLFYEAKSKSQNVGNGMHLFILSYVWPTGSEPCALNYYPPLFLSTKSNVDLRKYGLSDILQQKYRSDESKTSWSSRLKSLKSTISKCICILKAPNCRNTHVEHHKTDLRPSTHW